MSIVQLKKGDKRGKRTAHVFWDTLFVIFPQMWELVNLICNLNGPVTESHTEMEFLVHDPFLCGRSTTQQEPRMYCKLCILKEDILLVFLKTQMVES